MHTIENGFLRVTVSELGAELQSVKATDGTEFLWQGDSRYWKDRSPVLFPYVGRLTDGRYRLEGQEYPMGIHGFAAHSVFRTVKAEPERLELAITDTPETLAQYPRRFAFTVVYALAGNTLEVTFRVENRDTGTMYFGLGGHPGIRVPLTEGRAFSDYRLRFEEPCRPEKYLLSPSYYLSGATEPFPLEDGVVLRLNHRLFDDDALILRNISRQISLESEGDRRRVTVGFPGMPYLGIWHAPKTDAPYVCIEPWCTLPSVQDVPTVLEEQKDLLRLAPGAVYENHWFLRCEF